MSFVVGQRAADSQFLYTSRAKDQYTLESQCPPYNNEEEQLGKAFTDEMFLTIPANMQQ